MAVFLFRGPRAGLADQVTAEFGGGPLHAAGNAACAAFRALAGEEPGDELEVTVEMPDAASTFVSARNLGGYAPAAVPKPGEPASDAAVAAVRIAALEAS